MTTTAPIIMYDSPEAATYRTDIKGWVCRNGFFCGDGPGAEHQARWSGATHRECDTCGSINEVRSYCKTCRDKQVREDWLAMPIIEWDGKCMLAIHDDDRFFSDPDEFIEWCEDEGIEPGTVMLVATAGQFLSEVDLDYWQDDLPEDGDLPNDVADALEALNTVIRAQKEPICWRPVKKRVIVPTPADWTTTPKE